MTQQEIFMEILNKGEFQVSDLEREACLENVRKEVAHIIVGMCVSSKDGGNFPLSIILKAMSECKVKLSETKSAKKQALDIIKELEKVLPIKRAQMLTGINFQNEKQLLEFQEQLKAKFAGEYTIDKVFAEEGQFRIVAAIEPNLFRGINDRIFQDDKEFFQGCDVEIMEHSITKESTLAEKQPEPELTGLEGIPTEEDILAQMNDQFDDDPMMYQ